MAYSFEPIFKIFKQSYFQVYSASTNTTSRLNSLEEVDSLMERVGGQFRITRRQELLKKEVPWEY